MSRTVSQLAKKLNLTRQGIHNRINNIKGFKEAHVKKIHNAMVIDENGCKIISHFKYAKHERKSSHNQVTDDKYRNLLIKQLKSEINDLHKEIKIRDQNTQELHQELNQEQELHLALTGENHQLRKKIHKLDYLQKPAHKSFWQRLFGK